MMESASTLRTLDLPGGSVFPFVPARGERVRIVSGCVWVTEEGKPDDAFLASGEELDLAGRGLAVIEALTPARMQLLKQVRRPSRVALAVRRFARQLLAPVRRLAPRRRWAAQGLL